LPHQLEINGKKVKFIYSFVQKTWTEVETKIIVSPVEAVHEKDTTAHHAVYTILLSE
jgi:hypothetical protein